jgi:segregation and condensation protein A
MSSTAADIPDIPRELHLDLPSFQGPLDLLLELIRAHEIDIFDIPIASITRHYLGCLDQIQQLDLQVGGEWLEMAATLVYIKSRTLLPVDPDPDEEEGPDPREELVRRLIEHQLFQWAAHQLDQRPQLRRDFFLAAPRGQQEREELGPPPLKQASLIDLMDALKRVILEQRDPVDWVYEITRERLTLRGVILEIARLLAESPRIRFEALFASGDFSRHRVVTTFLALLEMARLNMIHLFQPRLSGEDTILIERAVIDIVEVSQTLELFDGP